MRNGLLKKIDRVLSNYLGIEKEIIKPISVQLISNKIYITNNLSFRRHKIKESWENFYHSSLKEIEPIESKKLGIALGKTIAKNLVIKFDSTEFCREKNEII